MPNPYLAAALREQQDRRRSLVAENAKPDAPEIDAPRPTKTGSKAADNNKES